MTTNTLHIQLTGHARTTANLESVTTAADVAVWRSAAEMLRERTYATGSGSVRVQVDWDPLVMRDHADESAVQFEAQVSGAHERDAESFAALFFHDAFLMLNLAVPGSFGGAITILSGGSELVLSARMFEYAWAAASRNGSPSIEILPLRDVVAWYDALQLGTQQVATDGVAKALFILLHLARREEDESTSVVRLGQALEALDVGAAPHFFELRDAIVHGVAPVLHPLADDALDDRVDDESLELVNASDFAASVVVSALQRLVGGR
jgi:hypothetical protein